MCRACNLKRLFGMCHLTRSSTVLAAQGVAFGAVKLHVPQAPHSYWQPSKAGIQAVRPTALLPTLPSASGPAAAAWHATTLAHKSTLQQQRSATTICAAAVKQRVQAHLPDSSFDACMELVARNAAQLSNSGSNSSDGAGSKTTPQLPAGLINQLQQQVKPEGDYWLLVRCAEWGYEDTSGPDATAHPLHPKGWEGPAFALLQVWANPRHHQLGIQEPGQPHKAGLDYDLWMVDPSGLPTGTASTDKYGSATDMENLTTKQGFKKYIRTFKVMDITPGSDTVTQGTRLETWLEHTFGKGTKLLHKRGGVALKPSAPKALSAAAPRLGGAGSDKRLAAYTGGWLEPGANARAALDVSATAAAGPAPVYVMPAEPPEPLSLQLHMDQPQISLRNKIVNSISSPHGRDDLKHTHIPVAQLLQSTTPGAATSSMPTTATAAEAEAQQHAAHTSPQVYSIKDLEDRAEAAEVMRRTGLQLPRGLHAVVPDSSRPFTLTMRNGKDDLDYVVAHYEPNALQYGGVQKAALLCELFHSRHPSLRMQRVSAGETAEAPPGHEQMVMAGMRTPRKGDGTSAHYGRYVGDVGPEADQFSFTCWPYLSTTGGFQAISELWMKQLPGLVCANSRAAADAARQGYQAPNRKKQQRPPWKGPPANFPAPCLLGSPFTTLGLTHNYFSLLHAEPREHPFSFITWHDVLGSGRSLQVGYFWLSSALAFVPKNGSALYIDVRLVPHCSQPCVVRDVATGAVVQGIEGRYGAALFIKPEVMQKNAELWAQFDQRLQDRLIARTMSADSRSSTEDYDVAATCSA